MESEKYKLGYKSCYIQDHPFSHLCSIPAEVAVEWVKRVCPDVLMGGCTAKELTIGGNRDTDVFVNGWTNKLFVLVANDHDKWIALTNWDNRFHVYVERPGVRQNGCREMICRECAKKMKALEEYNASNLGSLKEPCQRCGNESSLREVEVGKEGG